MPTLMPVDLASTLHELGLTLGRVMEREVWALCPVHKERVGKNDSKPTNFSVNVETGVANCFACGYKADLYKLVRDVLGINQWEAIRWLREHGATVVALVNQVTATKDFMGRKVDQSLIKENDPDLEFVLHGDVPTFELDKRNISRESADAYLIRWNGGWVLPFADVTGRVHGWQTKEGSIVRNYPKGRVKKSHYLFGAHCFEGERAILVESPLDAARIHTAGYDGAVASYGAIVSDQQLTLLVHLAHHVTLCLDNDEAGWEQTKRIAKALAGRIKLDIATYKKVPTAKDPGDLSDKGIDVLLEDTTSPLFLHRYGV